MTHELALSLVLVIALFANVLLVRHMNKGCMCDSCTLHVNDRRVALAKQLELRHDMEHKGPGWDASSQDRYSCHRADCDRNPK